MADMAGTFHKADNPFNLAKILDTGLNIAEKNLTPVVVNTTVAKPVLETPGTPTATGKKLDGDRPMNGFNFAKWMPWILGVVGIVAVGWLFTKK